MKNTSVKWEFNLRDMWIGVYWKKTYNYTGQTHPGATPKHRRHISTDIWICIIPCFPIHIKKHIHGPVEPNPDYNPCGDDDNYIRGFKIGDGF